MEPNNLPNHVLIVPDGNRRWAETHGKFVSTGHLVGLERFREVSKTVLEMGIRYFTFWAASEGNLKKRSPSEAQLLTSLFRRELERKSTRQNCLENKIKFRVLGNWFAILHDDSLLRSISAIRELTQTFDRHFLTILFGYDGMSELVDGVKTICSRPPRDVDGQILRRTLWTRDLPPVDLVLRTGTERPNWTHNSSGLLNPWLTPDSQIFSPQILWPDFTTEMFRQVVEDYSKIPRRLGA